MRTSHRSGRRPFQLAVLLLALLGAAAHAAPAAPDATALTIYSTLRPGAFGASAFGAAVAGPAFAAGAVPGYALVKLERTLNIESGRSSLRFTDVAALIDPTTVTFSVPGQSAVRVLSQEFQFDLLSTAKLLQRYIDRPITVERSAGGQPQSISGTLLASGDGLVLRDSAGTLYALRDYQTVRFPELPGGLITRPTLVWELQAPAAAERRARVSYQTGGVTWWADYNLIFHEGADSGSGLLELWAWVSIVNQSGAAFSNAHLKLVAGEVHRATPAPAPGRPMLAEMRVQGASDGFSEKAFDEYHLYTLGRPASLANNATQQIELFERAQQVPARRRYVYAPLAVSAYAEPYTGRDPGVAAVTQVQTWLEFDNTARAGLGVALPAGRVRVSRIDPADDSLEFIGEDVIGHTPRDETVRVQLGTAFDLVGERRQMDFAIDSHAHTMEERIEIRLRNHKAQPLSVTVREPLYRAAGWTVLEASVAYQKDSAWQIHFDVPVPAQGETTLQYRVRYHW